MKPLSPMVRYIATWVCTLLACAVIIAACARLVGAQDRAIPSPDRLASITATPTMDMQGTLHGFILSARFQSIDTKPSGEVTALPIGSVEVDLVRSNGSVVVGGELLYDRELADALMAVAAREWAKANPGALPQRRRALRVPTP